MTDLTGKFPEPTLNVVFGSPKLVEYVEDFCKFLVDKKHRKYPCDF